MNQQIYKRTIPLIGEQGLQKLRNSTVCVFGAGGVGSFAIEALARAGVGRLVICDFAKVDITNINRQLIALNSTVSQYKTHVFKERIKDINQDIEVITHEEFVTLENVSKIVPKDCDFIIDAIDSVGSKLDIITYALEMKTPIISCMGMGNKLDPSRFKITDIYKTSVCPLAKRMRNELKKRNVKKLDVLFSEEQPKKINEDFVSSISFVPASAGLRLAAYVVNKLI